MKPGHRLLLVSAVVVALLSVGNGAHGNDVPQIPVPLPSPTPTPAPAPDPPEEPPAEPPSEPLETEEPDQPEEAGQSPAEADETQPDESVEDWDDEDGLAHSPHGPFAIDAIESEPLDLKWSNFVAAMRGLGRYSLFDDRLKFRLGAKAQGDGTAGNGNDKFQGYYPEVQNSFKLRRFRAYAAGVWNNMNFLLGFDLGTDWGFKDAWVEGREGGLRVWGKYLGKLRIGQMREPFSLERQTSSFFTGFVERSLPVQTFSPGHNVGVMVHDAGKKGRMTWAVGLFSFGKSDEDNASTSALSLTTRWTFLPKYSGEGRHVMHFGASFSTRNPLGGDTQYIARPEARFAPILLDTGVLAVSHTTLFGAEFAMVQGPMWVQAEYIRADLDAQLLGDPTFMGAYGQVGFSLSGDVRPYRRNSGVFDRVQPTKNYKGGNPFKKKNGGSWEVVGRYSRVDLTNEGVDGGVMNDISAALNWYINATTRVQLNYIYASPKNRGAANVFVLRLQWIPW